MDERMDETTLSEDIEFKGKLSFEGLLRVEGKFEGEIESRLGHLVIGLKGEVVGGVKVMRLSHHGDLKGMIEVKEKLEVYETGKIEGEVKMKELEVRKGGMIEGEVKMKGFLLS